MVQLSLTLGVYQLWVSQHHQKFIGTEHPGPEKERTWRSNAETSREQRWTQQGGKTVVTDGSVHAAVCRRVCHGS